MARKAKEIRIVTIGGGTGAPVIIRSLIQAGFSDLSCISAVTDSGGKTGFLRTDERDRVIAISDLFRNLLSLIPPAKNHSDNISAFSDMIGFTDGRNRNLGYFIYYGLLEKYQNDFAAVQRHFERLLGKQFAGSAIPITTEPTNICFSTKGGIFHGEHELDRQSMSKNKIKKIWLEPEVSATKEAINAIENATHIIYSPGSLYGSILVNFLPKGIRHALHHSSAQKILITNLVSNRNQTHLFTPKKYFTIFKKYTGLAKPFDYIITPHLTITQFRHQYKNVVKDYAAEHAHYLGWNATDYKKIKQLGVQVISSDIFSLTQQFNRLRHDPKKLGPLLKEIIKKPAGK